MPLELREELVLLCEGLADQNFFRKLIEKRPGLPAFDIPFPRDNRGGVNAFEHALRALRGAGTSFANLKGILIVADSADDPRRTFAAVCSQIKGAEGFSVPRQPMEITHRSANSPAICVMLVPTETEPGGLESLCIPALADKSPWISQCVETYLACGDSKALKWSREKLDKARFHSMVAALWELDPGRSLSMAFKEPPEPLISVESPFFDGVAKRVQDFCEAVAAMS